MNRDSAYRQSDVVGTTYQGSNGGALPQALREWEDVGVGSRAGAGFTASTALTALLVLDCEYRPDLSVPDGAWIARCPLCRLPRTLRIWEASQREPDVSVPLWVSVRCRNGCAWAAIRERLLTPVRVLEAEERERQAWARYRWALDLSRQLLEVC